VHLGCKLADSLGFWVVKPLQPRTVEEIQEGLPPALKDRIHIDEERWRELLDRRVQCYADPDAPLSEGSLPPPEREALEEPNLPVEALAKKHLPDPNEQKPLVADLLMPVAIGLLIASIIVAVVHFAMTM